MVVFATKPWQVCPVDEVTAQAKLLFEEREASFFRLRGGFPIPLAGACWWAGLSVMGYLLPSRHLWIFVAFVSSGLIFPLALLFAKIFRNKFMQDKTSVIDVLIPAFISMLLFWPMAISAYWSYPQLVPLILGIGMSIHWPVVGWMYGRTALYSTHSIVRAIACFILWNWFPTSRFTLLPAAVSLIYALTVVVIFATSATDRRAAAE